MPHGYNGKILRVDLSTGKLSVEERPPAWYRKYLGGRGIGAYYLLTETIPGIDPFGTENLLIFAASVVTGAPFPGNARASVMAKSPLTGGFGESEAGGFWGPELKFSGYDAIVIKGKSERPVYLSIYNGKAELRDARSLWGLSTRTTENILQEELGDDKIQVASIGPAGENCVPYAAIMAGWHDAFGRLGMGAVMGSKMLKAVALRGTGSLNLKNPSKIKEINRWFAANFNKPETCALFYTLGTAGGVNIYNAMGALPSHNFQGGTLPSAENLSGEYMQEKGLMIGKTRCFACPVACRKIARINEPARLNTNGIVHSPEYETIGALGSNCGITDPKVVIKAAQLCDEYGLDTISTGVTISLAMEAVEKGILPSDVLGEKPLAFGNSESLLTCIELIARREAFGQKLALGARQLAEEIGAPELAVQSKGQELAVQDPRGGKIGAALGYAVSSHGGDHIQMEHDFQFAREGHFLKTMEPLGITEPVPAMDLGVEKVKLFAVNQKIWGLYNMLDICIFTAAPGHTLTLAGLQDIVEAVTGWETSLYELMEAGERGLVMARMYNLREGFTKQDDNIPPRLTEPLLNGAASGERINPQVLKQAVQDYYAVMGWSEKTGIPGRGKLLSLGLDWLIHSKTV
ncbi:MAG: aldehyde ferredoxin oxidoreductase family protein [Bacillota bacterium]